MIITENAAVQFKKIMDESGMTNDFAIRIGIIQDNDNLKYSINFETVNQEEDAEDLMNIKGVNLKINKKSKIYLENTKIDYFENSERSGFVFINLN